MHEDEKSRAHSHAAYWADLAGSFCDPTPDSSKVFGEHLEKLQSKIHTLVDRLDAIEEETNDKLGKLASDESTSLNLCDSIEATRRLDDVELAVDDLTQLSACKYAELETKVAQASAEIDKLSDCIVAKDVNGQPAGSFSGIVVNQERDSDSPLATSRIESLIDCRVEYRMKELLVGALQAALVPLAANFEERMAAFEAKVLGAT